MPPYPMHTKLRFETDDDSDDLDPNPYGGTGSSQPPFQSSTWLSGAYPQAEPKFGEGRSHAPLQPLNWQPGPYPQTQTILGGGSYPQPQPTWQTKGPYPQTQSILGGGSYPEPQPAWQTKGPYPQTQSILGGGSYPEPQPAWQTKGPYAQTQSILGGGSYPEPQPAWQTKGPYPQTQSILGGGSYPEPQPAWQTKGPYAQTQSILGGGSYPEPQPAWQTKGPYPQTQSILGGGSYPEPQPAWQTKGPYPQTQSILGGGSYPQPQSMLGGGIHPQAHSTWQLSGPYDQTQSMFGGGSRPQAQSTWQSSGPYDQTQSIPQAQSTWQPSGPYDQTQFMLGGGSYPQAHSTWQSSGGYAPGGGGWLPNVADQQETSLATIKNDEERIDDVGAGEAINRPKIILDPDNAKAISKVERVVDPDGEGSSLCCACRLPIFSTPSISFSHGGDKLFLHEKCECLPPQWLHELHPHQPLVLLNQLLRPLPPHAAAITCHNCKEICGAWFYHCPDPACDFQLDLLCVLQIKIVHRSHYQHAMTVIRHRESSSLTCSTCGTKHDSSSSSETLTRSYLCTLCGYWIHPDCASLLNAILHSEKHQHSLFLTYNLHTSTDSKCSSSSCSGLYKGSAGVFVCLNCSNYLVHINCALQNSDTFKPVFIRDAKASDLGRLPMENEHASLIPYIRHDTTQSHSDYYDEKFHAHPLTFHETDDGDQSCRVCNACVQSVSSLPFYSCSRCPDFFLHGCCAHLPTEIQHRVHQQHPLKLSQKAPKSDISADFSCKGCGLWCNGFAYSCETCDDFILDVVCAMINPAITYKPHKGTHILFMSRDIQFDSDEKCNCCSSSLNGICYECSICRNFKLHVRCALLPSTVGHEFDQHPLQLTTKESRADGGGDEEFCEVCEELIEKERCYYSCSECNQSFHVDCIPSVYRLSRIKLGANIRVDGHGCPVALVGRDAAVCGGRRCGSCREVLNLCVDGLAYECSQCFFGLHQKCAKKPFVELKS